MNRDDQRNAPTPTTLSVEVLGAAGIIHLNRPRRLNAINRLLVTELEVAAQRLADDDAVAAVVVSGGTRAFCAGADIAEVAELTGPAESLDFLRTVQDVCNRLDDLPKPTIAAIEGPALGGGCELALACDLRIMSADAVLGVPEIKIGVLPGAGGTQRLPRLLPTAVAKQMLLLGEPLTADQALHFGVVNRVVPDGSTLDAALAWVEQLARLPAQGLRAAKELVRVAADGDLRSGLVAEREAVTVLFSTEDRVEGMQAFLERRAPRFKGH